MKKSTYVYICKPDQLSKHIQILGHIVRAIVYEIASMRRMR